MKKRSLLEKRDDFYNYSDEISKINALLLLAKHDTQGRKLFEVEGDNLVQNEYVVETVPDYDNNNNNNNNNNYNNNNYNSNIKQYNNNIPQFNTNFQNKQVVNNKFTKLPPKMPYRYNSNYNSNNYNSNSNSNGAMAFKMPYKMKTVVRTIKKTISSNIKSKTTTALRSVRVAPITTTRRITTTTRKITTTTRRITTTTRKITTTTRKITTTTTRKITTTQKAVVATNNAVSSNSNNVYQPKPGTKFQWQLSGCNHPDTSVNADVFDFDLFETPVSKIKELQSKGKKVICYFSGGTIESWRDDAEDFLKKGVVMEEMEDWEDENWVNIRSSKLKPLIQNRLDIAVQKGCDGVEIDNVDGYTFKENDFTYNEQLKFNKWLAEEAHKRKLSIGLKNDMGQIKDLLPHYDWALNEECYEYGECELYKPFIQANKAVFGVSYLKNSKKIADACKLANQLKLDYQIKNLDLDADKIDCSLYK